jgi:hypothetical protein
MRSKATFRLGKKKDRLWSAIRSTSLNESGKVWFRSGIFFAIGCERTERRMVLRLVRRDEVFLMVTAFTFCFDSVGFAPSLVFNHRDRQSICKQSEGEMQIEAKRMLCCADNETQPSRRSLSPRPYPVSRPQSSPPTRDRNYGTQNATGSRRSSAHRPAVACACTKQREQLHCSKQTYPAQPESQRPCPAYHRPNPRPPALQPSFLEGYAHRRAGPVLRNAAWSEFAHRRAA